MNMNARSRQSAGVETIPGEKAPDKPLVSRNQDGASSIRDPRPNAGSGEANLRPSAVSQDRFLIIGGASKAGTTSVFEYLSGHPQICASTAKETRFFLDPDYPLPAAKQYHRNGPEEYQSFFLPQGGDRQSDWRLEATPDYLYSRNTSELIRRTLPNAQFVFILREPVSRLVSMYRFAQAMNAISSTMTFDEYVHIQIDNSELYPVGAEHPAFYALQHGRYSDYLPPFIESFGRSSVHVFFYDALKRDAHSFMTSLCRAVDIDPAYFQNRSFEVVNQSRAVRSPLVHRAYVDAKQSLRRSLRSATRIRYVLRQFRKRIDSTYDKLNMTGSNTIVMSPATRQVLNSYYNKEARSLRDLLGVDVPWS